MDNNARLEIFKAQTRNTRTLVSARTQIRRAINHGLRTGDTASVAVQNRILALLFCAWAEANFSKVIHTPHGFSFDEIRQIKRLTRENSIVSGWHKAIELGLKKVEARASPFVPNARQTLQRTVKRYVEEPSLIRNKIAHGQWTVALNRENTNKNESLSQSISRLNIVTLDLWFECHERLAHIVETLIESPRRAFMRDYWKMLTELESALEEMSSRTIERHIEKLKKKPARPKF